MSKTAAAAAQATGDGLPAESSVYCIATLGLLDEMHLAYQKSDHNKGGMMAPQSGERSEEHTSELQSQR